MGSIYDALITCVRIFDSLERFSRIGQLLPTSRLIHTDFPELAVGGKRSHR